LFRKRNQRRDDVALVVVDLDERRPEAAEEPAQKRAQRERRDGCTERSENDQDDGFVAPENNVRVRSADITGEKDGSEPDDQARDSCKIQQKSPEVSS